MLVSAARHTLAVTPRIFAGENLREVLARALAERETHPQGVREARAQLREALKAARRALVVARVREASQPGDRSLVVLRHRAKAEVLFLQALQLQYQDLLG